MKRSNKPIFWSLFGAGGLLAALIGPMLVFLTGVTLATNCPFTPFLIERPVGFSRGDCARFVLCA